MITVTLVLAAPSVASADRHGYVGVHPRDDGGLCYIEAAHYHVYAPKQRKLLYRDHGDQAYFIGDPVAYGYDGPRHAYVGHHPVAVGVVLGADAVDDHATEYCYLDGAHYHTYAPLATARFELKGEAYWYVGKLPKAYHAPKKRLVRVNTVYEPIVYERPVVVVEPPSAWIGVSAGISAPVVAADVEVHTPAVGVEVVIPQPVFEIGIGGHVRGHKHYRHRKHKHYKHKKHKRYRHKRYKGKRYKGKRRSRSRRYRW